MNTLYLDEARSKALAKTVTHPGNLGLTRLLLNDGASPDFQVATGCSLNILFPLKCCNFS